MQELDALLKEHDRKLAEAKVHTLFTPVDVDEGFGKVTVKSKERVLVIIPGMIEIRIPILNS